MLPRFQNRLVLSLITFVGMINPADWCVGEAPPPQYETDILPIFADKCFSCHGDDVREANLDLRTLAAIRRGGDSGSAIEGDVTSLLMEQIHDEQMPPEGEPQLTQQEVSLIRRWLRAGSPSANHQPSIDAWSQRLQDSQQYWAFQPPRRPPIPGQTKPSPSAPSSKHPNPVLGTDLRPTLEAWYRAESLTLDNGQRVMQWDDESGHQRHLTPTWGRMDSQVGTPPRLMARSTIAGQPAVRFDDLAGLGSSAANPVPIDGDGQWTITAVINVRPPGPHSHTSVVAGFGDPAPGHNPGQPWASLLEIRRDQAFLSHSGGYGHDARLPNQSMWSAYDKSLLVTLVKHPGAMSRTTMVYINGHRIPRDQISGVDSHPEIHHRDDFSIYLGRANGSLGALRGDIAELAIFSEALPDQTRATMEQGLISKYQLDTSNAWSDLEEGDQSTRNEHPIDAFLDAKRRERNLDTGPLADRRTLIRRASFDLIGLPPSPEDVQAFVDDQQPGAWQRVIEKLLNSPHYGERWGRHWLDVARYADTGGYETDVYYRNAWRYRDYVVKSFNDDKPYDQFVQEQIAGDELWPDNLDLSGSYIMDPEKKRHLEARTGTGLYALGPQIHESNMDAKKLRNERLTDWIDTTASAFMGLTFACARCHDHKFDPISQRDYYSLQAAFANSCEVEVPLQHGMGLADWKQHYPKVIALQEARMAYQTYAKHTSRQPRTPEQEAKLAALKSAIADALLAVPEKDAQGEVYQGIYERPTVTVLGHLEPALTPAVKLLSRGELNRPKQVMSPALPRFLQLSKDPVTESIGRKELAMWLTQPDHPLTARVMVNRIWQWHFGRGIVPTANDFGKMGTLPSHPELLDWLAVEFVDRGWSVKAMHRLIMTSQAYQRSSDFHTERHQQIDPENRLLWRMNRRRLEGEAIWDAIHSVSGTINLTLGGRPIMPTLLAEELTNKSNWVAAAIPSHHSRRGLYIIVRRNFNFPLFSLFDAPVSAVSCSGREVSTVAPQALWLLNNHLAFGQAKHFAARLVREQGMDTNAQVERAWLLATGRAPSDQEVRESLQLITQLEAANPADLKHDAPPSGLEKLSPQEAAALTQFCLTLFNLNEFIYVD